MGSKKCFNAKKFFFLFFPEYLPLILGVPINVGVLWEWDAAPPQTGSNSKFSHGHILSSRYTIKTHPPRLSIFKWFSSVKCQHCPQLLDHLCRSGIEREILTAAEDWLEAQGRQCMLNLSIDPWIPCLKSLCNFKVLKIIRIPRYLWFSFCDRC